MIEEGFGLLFDFIPYGIGRAAIAIASLGQWKCEPWEPLIWTVDLWTGPLKKRVDGQVVVTRRGVRMAGGLVIMCLGLLVVGLVGCLIWLFS